MIKNILTVGDSFTHGDELSDRNNAWPCILAKQLQADVTNKGDPGCANWRMIRWVIESCQDADLVIIAWSSYLRLEFADQKGDFIIWPGCNLKNYTDYPSHRNDLIKYLTAYHNKSYLYEQYLNNIILIQNYLKQNEKKYIMLDAFENNKHEDERKHTKLVDQIDTTYFLGWPDESMMEWTLKTTRGPRGHFLDQGHEIVANKIYEHIRHLGWVS